MRLTELAASSKSQSYRLGGRDDMNGKSGPNAGEIEVNQVLAASSVASLLTARTKTLDPTGRRHPLQISRLKSRMARRVRAERARPLAAGS